MTHEERYHYNGRCYAGLPETNSIPVNECKFDPKPLVYVVGRLVSLDCDYGGYGYGYNRYYVTLSVYNKTVKVPVVWSVWEELTHRLSEDRAKFMDSEVRLVIEQ